MSTPRRPDADRLVLVRQDPPSRERSERGTLEHDSDGIKTQLEQARRERHETRYILKLYVTGFTATSRRAIERVRTVCEEHLRGRYELDVIDVYELPALARNEQIVATPTLIKVLPAPLRRYVGNLANVENVLFGLDLRERP